MADCEVIINTNKESSNDSTNLASGAKMDNEILEIFQELEDEREDGKKAAEGEAVKLELVESNACWTNCLRDFFVRSKNVATE